MTSCAVGMTATPPPCVCMCAISLARRALKEAMVMLILSSRSSELSARKGSIQFFQLFDGADVDPFAAINLATDLAACRIFAQQRSEFGVFAGRNRVEHLRAVHADIAEGVQRRAFVGDSETVQGEVAGRMMRRIFYQINPGDVALVQWYRISPQVVVFKHRLDLFEIEVRNVDVARDGDEGFFSQ